MPDLRDADLMIAGRKGRAMHAVLNRFQLNSEVGWRQRRFIIPGLLERNTLFQIAPHVDGTGVTLTRIEPFSGLTVPFLKGEARKVRSDIRLSNMELRESRGHKLIANGLDIL